MLEEISKGKIMNH